MFNIPSWLRNTLFANYISFQWFSLSKMYVFIAKNLPKLASQEQEQNSALAPIDIINSRWRKA